MSNNSMKPLAPLSDPVRNNDFAELDAMVDRMKELLRANEESMQVNQTTLEFVANQLAAALGQLAKSNDVPSEDSEKPS